MKTRRAFTSYQSLMTMSLGVAAALVMASLSASAILANGVTPEATDMSETITGTLIGPGVECLQFRLGSGEQISITGDIPDLDQDVVETLEGRWVRISHCMQGRTFQVLDEPK